MSSAAPTERAAALDAYYASLEGRFVISLNGDYETLVTPNGNSAEPIHRWFHVKEAFSHRLLSRVIKDTELDQKKCLTIVDPFSGSGTTGASAADLVREGQLETLTIRAYEVNPFLCSLGQAKIDAATRPPQDFLLLTKRVAALARNGRIKAAPIPKLTTFARPEYFPPVQLSSLLNLRAALDECEKLGMYTPEAVRLTRVCLAATVEPSSKLRRDGRALRYEEGKQPVRPITEFLAKAHLIDEDLTRRRISIAGGVRLGDIRQAADLAGLNADLALFSPPYPNNIDYTEVYKLENWLVGWINNQDEFTRQRRQTLRSHPSVRFPADSREDSEDRKTLSGLLDPVLDSIPPDTRYAKALARLVWGYFEDMLGVMRCLHKSLKPGSRLVYVVGNSLHGSRPETRFLIAADILLAVVAEIAGFRIDQINIARTPSRRRSVTPFLRESVVTATRP